MNASLLLNLAAIFSLDLESQYNNIQKLQKGAGVGS